jgi:hypothetical protein
MPDEMLALALGLLKRRGLDEISALAAFSAIFPNGLSTCCNFINIIALPESR